MAGFRILNLGVLAMALLALASPAIAGPSAFDGSWDATLTCPKAEDGTMGYSYEFRATVKEGLLHGERGMAGEPGWMQLDGPIKEDGSAALIAEGLTNLPSYAVHHTDRGTHYKHGVTAHFDGAKGEGSWITIRTCTFAFTKETS